MNTRTRKYLFQSPRQQQTGFSILEALVVVSVIGTMAAVSIGIMSKIKSSADREKLQHDIHTLNTAVGIYQATGGSLDGATSPLEVIDKLKSVVNADLEERMPGLTGSMIDPRLAPVTCDTSPDGIFAEWNPETMRFELVDANTSTQAIKIECFELGTAPTVALTEARDPAMLYSKEDSWVWDYQDRAASIGTGPTTVSLADDPDESSTPTSPTSPIPPATPADDLAPPEFSISSGDTPITDFDLSLELTNPNPPGSSELVYSVNNGDWTTNTGSPVIIPPEAEVRAQALSNDPLAWNSSPVAQEIYGVIPGQLAPPEIQIGPTPNGAVPGGTVVTVTNTNDSAISGLSYRLDGGAWQPYSTPFTVPLTAEDTLVEAKALATAEYYLDSAPSAQTIPGEAASSTAVIDADADTSIAATVPDWNGFSGQVYSNGIDPAQTLLHFDLSGDVAGAATVESAVLYLTSIIAGTDGDFAAHGILPGIDWITSGITWNEAGDGFQTDDAELDSAAQDTSTVTTTIPGVPGASDRKKWDITALVQRWVDDPTSNNGVAILAAPGEREIFCSREHPGETVRPKLVITWTTVE